MTLNVAQYLAPLGSQQVLTGYVQGVKDGSGLTIAPDGTISLNTVEASALGFLVSSSTPAPVLNWPSAPGSPSSVLTSDGLGNLTWASDYVQTFPIGSSFPHTGAAYMPSGNTAQRPSPGIIGFFRYNTDLQTLEWFNGGSWVQVSGPSGGVLSFVSGVAPTAHAPGDLWYDVGAAEERVWTGATWAPVAPPSAAPSFRQIDDIGPLFDGFITSFQLQIGGVPYTPSPSSNLMVFLGGIAQTPGIAYSYTVSGNTIIFSVAPPVGVSFYATTVG